MKGQTRNRRTRRAITWIGGGALSVLLLVPAAEAGPIEDLRRLHRMHRRVHQEIRREVRHTVRHLADDGRHRHRRHRVRRGHRHVLPGHARRHDPRPRHVDPRFHVPVRIEARYVDRYRPYHAGEVWFEPHGHRHTVYEFPVATPYGYDYEPHYYCDGARFRLELDRPGLLVSVGF